MATLADFNYNRMADATRGGFGAPPLAMYGGGYGGGYQPQGFQGWASPGMKQPQSNFLGNAARAWGGIQEQNLKGQYGLADRGMANQLGKYQTDAQLYGNMFGNRTAYQIAEGQALVDYEKARGQSGDDTGRLVKQLEQNQRALEAQERMYGVGSETDRYRADRGMQGQLGAAQYGMQGVLGSADSRMRGTLGSAQYGMQGLLGATQMQSDASRYASQQAADAQRAISRDRRFSDTLAARLGIVPSQMQQKRFERIIPLFSSLINRFTPSSV